MTNLARAGIDVGEVLSYDATLYHAAYDFALSVHRAGELDAETRATIFADRPGGPVANALADVLAGEPRRYPIGDLEPAK